MAGEELGEVEGVDIGQIGDLVSAAGARGDHGGIARQGFNGRNQRFCDLL
jgi:hypothetical protein